MAKVSRLMSYPVKSSYKRKLKELDFFSILTKNKRTVSISLQIQLQDKHQSERKV